MTRSTTRLQRDLRVDLGPVIQHKSFLELLGDGKREGGGVALHRDERVKLALRNCSLSALSRLDLLRVVYICLFASLNRQLYLLLRRSQSPIASLFENRSANNSAQDEKNPIRNVKREAVFNFGLL